MFTYLRTVVAHEWELAGRWQRRAQLAERDPFASIPAEACYQRAEHHEHVAVTANNALADLLQAFGSDEIPF